MRGCLLHRDLFLVGLRLIEGGREGVSQTARTRFALRHDRRKAVAGLESMTTMFPSLLAHDA